MAQSGPAPGAPASPAFGGATAWEALRYRIGVDSSTRATGCPQFSQNCCPSLRGLPQLLQYPIYQSIEVGSRYPFPVTLDHMELDRFLSF